MARSLATVALTIAVAACSVSPAATPTSSPVREPVVPSAAPSPSPSPPPSPDLSPGAEPIEPSPGTWSEPRAVGSSGNCHSVAAVIDATGGSHIAAGCDGRIRYLVQIGTDWDTTEFAPPAKREEHDPQLAFDGNVLYLAYTRIAVEEGGCGDPGLRDDGVYVRSRRLPAGGWSEPQPIGEIADHVQSLRAVGRTIHAAVANEDDGQIYYETLRGEAYHRYEIPNATGEVALRVGDDGNARVAYEADGALWYGIFRGADFSTARIEASDRGYTPVLVLGPGDRPFLVWARGYHGRGCTEPDPEPEDGTYFSTQEGGAWKSERLSPGQGAGSLTLDIDDGRIHALVNGPGGIEYVSRAGSEPWTRRVLVDQHGHSAVIRLDPQTGALLVAYLAYEDDATQVFVLTYR